MEENEKRKKSGGSGFVFGMVVGGALVFLLGTKQGRRLLQGISDRGLEILENLAEVKEYEMPYSEEEFEEEAVVESLKPEEPKITEQKEEHHANGHSPSIRRLFKGAKRK